MPFRVHLTSRAEQDLDYILGYLVSRSPQGAATWLDRWEEILEELAQHADAKPLAPENDDHDEEIRHVVFKTRRGRFYRAVFTIQDDLVNVTHLRGPGQDTLRQE